MSSLKFESLLTALGVDASFTPEDKEEIKNKHEEGWSIYQAIDEINARKILQRIEELVEKIEGKKGKEDV